MTRPVFDVLKDAAAAHKNAVGAMQVAYDAVAAYKTILDEMAESLGFAVRGGSGPYPYHDPHPDEFPVGGDQFPAVRLTTRGDSPGDHHPALVAHWTERRPPESQVGGSIPFKCAC